MDREINFDSIRALEKQIQDHEKVIVQLKRTRNSLLNVSTLLPPEILGSIFLWNVIPDGDFGGVLKGSYNFLLVCHHWFEVASCTPKLWCFWGNTVRDWSHRYARYRTAPLDLVLSTEEDGNHKLDDSLYDALQDRAARDTIRRVHLSGFDARLLNSVIFSVVAEGEGTRLNSVESFILENGGVLGVDVDVSGFFSRYRLPKLQHLRLSGSIAFPWDLPESQTTSLTTLSLTISDQSPVPTLSQLLSILSSNPNLQHLVLYHGSVPLADGDRSSSQTQLRHLKSFCLASDFRRVFGLLKRLELPEKMDDLNLNLPNTSPSDLSQTLGPYIGDRARRRGGSPDGLGLLVYSNPSNFYIRVGDAPKGNDPTRVDSVKWFITAYGFTNVELGEDTEKLWFDIIGQIPQEEVTSLTTNLSLLHSVELCIQMCNLTCLRLSAVDLSTWFIEPDIHEPHTFKDLLPGLDSISITNFILGGGDWRPLTNFLSRRAAVGNPISLLRLTGRPYMSKGVVKKIKHVVKVFKDEDRDCDEDD